MDLVGVLEKINKASIRFLQPLTPETTYKTIIAEAIKLVNGDYGYIALEEENALKIKYAYPQALGIIRIRKKGFSYTSFSQKRAFVTYIENFRNIHPELVASGIQSTCFIPLSNKGKSIGVMNIMSCQRIKRFSRKELAILKLYGSMASMAIHKTQLYSEVKTTLESRDLFLSMAAHEFRTPITTISGYAQLLRKKPTLGITEKNWVEEIYRETQRLTRLMKELLEVSRIHSGRFQYNFQENNLAKILYKVIEAFKISYPDYQLNFENTVTGEGSMIICDNDKIIQVLNNILDNSAKFSPQAKEVDIKLRENKDDLIIQIKDYGQGIAKQDLVKVFEGFYRGINNTKEGMGLGLYLSSQILKEHRGKIRIKSEINRGTIVEISFPKITTET